mmetsp:Transcript_52159/g.118922  ORF Transcript_52159/g.118922 Transcript_52159/m.118922 type:complete len:203 (+) Transcript_52159:505-1113(+)
MASRASEADPLEACALALVTKAHRSPNLSAWSVSSAWASSPRQQTRAVVRLAPPSAPRSSVVSLHSRYGTCRAPSTRAPMTFPRTMSDSLMPTASRFRAPSALDFLSRSEPARSTKCKVECTKRPPRVWLMWSTRTVCAREDRSFIAVAANFFRAWPARSTCRASSRLATDTSTAPTRLAPPCASRRRSQRAPVSKSVTTSL